MGTEETIRSLSRCLGRERPEKEMKKEATASESNNKHYASNCMHLLRISQSNLEPEMKRQKG
jgi:hypothetical protein